MEDRDGEGDDYSGGRIFFLVCRKLSSQARVNCAHVLESWVRDTHGHKYMSHGADVLFHASFVDGIVVGRKDNPCGPCEKIFVGGYCVPVASEIG